MSVKRAFDVVVAAFGLAILAPLFAALAILIRLDSSGPVFFRQQRVGLRGRLFRIHKFRTMSVDAPSRGPGLTVGRDPRITRIGKVLRRYKLDELPQLIDVLRGEMSLVGPRPELPKYVALYPEKMREKVLSVRPGITDLASLQYIDENEMLARASDPEREYIERVLPEKLHLYEQYVDQRSVWLDGCIIAKTLVRVIARRADVARRS